MDVAAPAYHHINTIGDHTMTHSISTIARRSAALLLAGVLGYGASASMAEPTAQDMKAALESRFAAINEGMSDVADRCNR